MNKFKKVIAFLLCLSLAFMTISCFYEGTTSPSGSTSSGNSSSNSSNSSGNSSGQNSSGSNTDGGEGTNPDGGEGTNPDGGEGSNPDGGEGSNPDGGEGSNPDGGEGTNPDGGEGTNPDGGETQPEWSALKPINDESLNQRLIKTKYETDGVVVANAIATDYGADPTGENDSTKAIQSALDYVADLGGGTVFLPIGKYLVTSTIRIPSYVSLVGDWNKPVADNTDADFDYGTVILAKPNTLGSLNPQDKPLIALGNVGGVVGLTFFYVEQDVKNVKQYGYTIYAGGPYTATFKNLTFLNSTYGIGVSLNDVGNELVNLENIYGTFLYNAIRHNATSDVGFYDNINVSAKYWQNASSQFKCANKYSLNTFISNNLTAMILGDLDDQLISNVSIDAGKIGIKFTTGLREGLGFWGLIYNANITCKQGVYADCLNSASGVVFTNSNVGAVENNSPVGCIKMSNTTYQGSGTGKIIQEGGEIAKSVDISPLSLKFSSSERLFVAKDLAHGGSVNNSARLQQLLDSVGSEGGVVVIPNGIYRLDSTVTIPSNVEIRSTQSVFTRSSHVQTNNNGVVFISYVSGNTFLLKEGAGVVGVRIWHAKNDFITAQGLLDSGTYPIDVSIKADGAGAYAYMNESVGAYVGYDFSNCDNHILKSNYGISYANFIKAGGKDGVINQCLTNPNFMTRSNLYTYFNSLICNVDNWRRISESGEANEDFAILRDGIGRKHTKMVRLEDAENQIAMNVFAYGHAGLFDMADSTVTLVNTSLDYIVSTKYLYELTGGSCDIVGSLRVYGTSIKVNSGTLTAYGRIGFGQIKEATYNSAVSLEDKIQYVSENARRMTLFNCNSWNFAFNVSLNSSSSYAISGKSWKWSNPTDFHGKFNSVDLSDYRNGYLHFYVYCSDISKIGRGGQIEITSSGTWDVNECGWDATQYITKTGWNEVWVELSTGQSTNGVADFTCINFMRIYLLDATATFYIDEIEVVTD